MIQQISRSRGMKVAEEFPADWAAFVAASYEALLGAALAGADEADLLAAISRRHDGADG